MDKKLLFNEALTSLVDFAAANANHVTMDDVKLYFKDLIDDDSQYQFIYKYLPFYLSFRYDVLLLIKFQYTHKCLLWDFYISKLAHPLFTFFLFFKKFSLSGNITTVTFGKYIFSHCPYCLSCYYFSSDCRLYRDFKKLSRYLIFKFLTHLSSTLAMI